MEPRSITHRHLFERTSERRCDVCNAIVEEDDDDASSALYVWTRGDETRYEEPPLCSTCGPTIGLAQVRRWQIEDDEEG